MLHATQFLLIIVIKASSAELAAFRDASAGGNDAGIDI